MRRNSHALLAAVSAALAAVLLIAGGLLLWGSAYVHNTVQSQLAAQQITFPPAAAFAHAKAGTEITPSMIPSVSQYAGQQLLTGQQAEAYADHFIAVHITSMCGGKTYSQLSAASLAQPDNTRSLTDGRHRVQGRDAAVHAAERLRLVEGLPDHLHRRAGQLRPRHRRRRSPPGSPSPPAAAPRRSPKCCRAPDLTPRSRSHDTQSISIVTTKAHPRLRRSPHQPGVIP